MKTYYFILLLIYSVTTNAQTPPILPNSTVTIITNKDKNVEENNKQLMNEKNLIKPKNELNKLPENKLPEKNKSETKNKANNLVESKIDSLPTVKSIAEKKLYTADMYFERSTLLVFASFSIPEPSLRKLLIDAEKYKAVVVFNGLYQNSVSKTQQKIINIIYPEYKNIKAKTQAEMQSKMLIQKKLYEEEKLAIPKITFSSKRFKDEKIKHVPAFVLSSPKFKTPKCDDKGCDLSMINSTVYGDVSVDYALDVFYRQSAEQDAIAKYYINNKKN